MNNKQELLSNYQLFVTSVVSIVNLLKKASVDMDYKLNDGMREVHNIFRKSCDDLLNEYIKKPNTDSKTDGYDSQFTKKIFKTLTENLSLLKNKDESLFMQKNKDGQIITLLTGVHIGFMYKHLSTEEKDQLWLYLYMMYSASVRIIYSINSDRKKDNVLEAVSGMEKEISEKGVMIKGKVFNPYLGVNNDKNEKFGVDEILSGKDGIQAPLGITPESMLQMLGVDKMLDAKAITEQLQNIDEKDIDEATKGIATLLGAKDDSDVNEICSTLVRNIVGELKTNGMNNFFETANKVAEKLGDKLDSTKMKKTALKMNDMMQNSESKLKDLKDDKGNPIGADIFSKLSIPLQLAKAMAGNSEAESSKKNTPIQKSEKPLKKK